MTSDTAALPKYLQVSERLIRDMQSGRLAAGDRLPPEREMARDLGVAVGTLRKALARLAQQGVLTRIQGSGNYISYGAEPSAIYEFFRLERPEGGGLPQARLLDAPRMTRPRALPDFGGDGAVFRIRRLRLLDEVAVAVEEIWLDAACAPDLGAAPVSESLYLYYRESLGLEITAVEDRVGVAPMPGWAPDIGLSPGAPAGHAARRSRTADGEVPEISRTWFNPDRASYVARQGAWSNETKGQDT